MKKIGDYRNRESGLKTLLWIISILTVLESQFRDSRLHMLLEML